MKAVTHYLFSTGVSLGLVSSSGSLDLRTAAFALWLSLAVNYFIDALGHITRDGRPARTRLTHSMLTAPLWGAVVSLASSLALSRVPGLTLPSGTLIAWTFLGVLVSEEHLFLDSLTQAGIYGWRRRIAIAHFRYDSVPLNFGFALIGAVLIAAAFGL